MISNKFVGRLVRAAGIVVCLAGASAMANVVDFEGLLTGQSVNGQAGWTVEDADAWWREFQTTRDGATESGPGERTQLAVDVEGRG